MADVIVEKNTHLHNVHYQFREWFDFLCHPNNFLAGVDRQFGSSGRCLINHAWAKLQADIQLHLLYLNI